jgi:hypothetical protein
MNASRGHGSVQPDTDVHTRDDESAINCWVSASASGHDMSPANSADSGSPNLVRQS